MSLIVDISLKPKFAAVKQRSAVYATDGTYLGIFDPGEPGEGADLEPKVSYEEMKRRIATEKGRPLADILRDLEARG
jgi:hypothetical protein